MSREHFEQMLDYYQREMVYLRNAGSQFAKRYPKIAQGLDLSQAGSGDPHVERLLESFAFLTARLQKEVDNKFVRFADTLLDVLYPHFTRPFPSTSIANFRIDPALGKSAAGYTVPKGTRLYIDTKSKQTCRFQTCYPVKLWPLDIVEAEIVPTDETNLSLADLQSDYLLRIRIARDDGPLSDIQVDRLRVHLTGDRVTTNFLYDAIFSYDPLSAPPVFIQADSAEQIRLADATMVQAVGFAPDENLIPYPMQVHAGYRLLHEYFAFPQKFKFFDLVSLPTGGARKFLDLYLPLATSVKTDRFRVSKNNFALGCTPIVNLFRKITEPINLDQTSLSYPLVPDQREIQFTEIHSIERVQATRAGDNKTLEYTPYFSYNHKQAQDDQALFWSAYRQPASQADTEGSEVFLTFLDYDFSPHQPANQTVFAHVLCTNRNLAQHLPVGSVLHIEDTTPSTRVTTLERPTPQINATMEGEALWKIISQLSLNHLTLSGAPSGTRAFQELLRLYAQNNKSNNHGEINAIDTIRYSQATRRTSRDAWRGFVQGISVNLQTQDASCDGSATYLLCTVLSYFLGTYVGMNSFAQLTLKSNKMPGIWKQWPPQIGTQTLL